MADSQRERENVEVVHEVRRVPSRWEAARQRWPSQPSAGANTEKERDPLALLAERELRGAMLSLREVQRQTKNARFAKQEAQALGDMVQAVRTQLDAIDRGLVREKT
jgi:hypothetical protein